MTTSRRIESGIESFLGAIATPVAFCIALVGTIVALGAVAIFVWQIYTFLRHGIWESVSIIFVLSKFGLEWARQPADWLGVHILLDYLPAWPVIFVIGASIIFAGLVIQEQDFNLQQ